MKELKRQYDYVASWDSRKRWKKRLPFIGLRRDIKDQNSLFWGIELNGKTYQVQDIDIDSNVRYGKVRAIERETGKVVVIVWKNGKFRRIYHRKKEVRT